MPRLAAVAMLTGAVLLAACGDTSRPLHEVVLVPPDMAGATAALVRYNTLTGETFISTQGRNWRPVRDDVIVGTSSYRVIGTFEQGLLTVIRLDENTGRSWRLDKSKWAEMPVGGNKQDKADKGTQNTDAPAALPAGDGNTTPATGTDAPAKTKTPLTPEEKAAKKAAKKAEKQRLKEQDAAQATP